jgi:phosphoribosylglycinamide formyltransferase-1
MTLRLGVLVSGNGTNLQAILDAIEAGSLDAEVRLFLSDQREAFALKRAEKQHVPTALVVRKDFSDRSSFEKKIVEVLQERGVQWVVLAGFMRLLSPEFIGAYPQRIVNIHPALLPSFPGLEAIRQAFEYGSPVTGVTVHFVDEGCDTGPIIAQRAIEVDPQDTLESLSEKIHRLEHSLYPQVLQWISEGRLKIEGRKVVIRK